MAEPAWLTDSRKRAANAARSLSLPNQKVRGWEFTNLSELDLASFEPADEIVAADLDAPTILPAPEGALTPVAEASGNGRPDGPIVMPLEVAAERYGDLLSEHFGTIVPSKDNTFVTLNEVGWRGGALIYVPKGAKLEAPVALNAIQRQSKSTMTWRTMIVLEEGAEAEVWEQYGSASEDIEALLNSVTEIVVGPNARLRYVCTQGLSPSSWIFANQRAVLDRDASLDWVALGFGSARGKVRMEIKLAGRGSEARVTGAYAGTGRQHLDYDTRQEHAAPDTTSDLAFRGVLGGRSTAVWRGMIRVDPEAQRTDAFQDCRNLLVSNKAHADAIPGLEIEADDVACTHAAAVAQVDPEQLYYLTSRGLDDATARRLIVGGFLGALAERMAKGPTRDAVTEALDARLRAILDG